MSNVLKRDLAGDYRLLLSWRYNQVEMLGLPSLKETRPLRLDYLYIPPRFSWEHRGKETFWLPKALSEHKHLVVLGDPGAGKSTLVKSITYSFGKAGETALSRTFGKLLPIPIILRDYRVSQWQNYRDMLADFIKQLDEKIRDDISVDWVLDFLHKGEAILLLDGLDEVGNVEIRLHLRDQIVLPLLREFNGSYVLITSRIIGYDEAPFDQIHSPPRFDSSIMTPQKHMIIVKEFQALHSYSPFQRMFTAPFNDEDIEQFIVRWYGMREEEEARRREGIESLKRAIQSNDRVKQLATNPQMLTLMALIHRNLSVLPSGRVKLYDKIVEAYLETIDVYRKLGQYPASLEQMKRWLAHVGWQMQLRRRNEDDWGYGDDLLASRRDVLDWLTEAIAKERDNAAEEAEQFLDFVARRSGLLIPRGVDPKGADEFSFIHLTFQEYFAAYYLRGMVWDFNKLVEEVSSRIKLQHWHETILVLFEMLAEMRGSGDRLIKFLIDQAKEPKQREAATEIFSALLIDSESGLSLGSQQQAAEFARDAMCNEIDNSVVKNLKQLPAERLREWIEKPLIEKLKTAKPDSLKADFFLVGDEFVADWPRLIEEELVGNRGSENWAPNHLAPVTLIGTGRPKVIEWVGGRLPVHYWLTPVFYPLANLLPIATSNNQEVSIGGVSIAELNLTLILKTRSISLRQQLLTQSALALAVIKSQILRKSIAWLGIRSSVFDRDPLQNKYLEQYLDRFLKLHFFVLLNRCLERYFDPSLIRYLDQYLNPVYDTSISLRYLPQFLSVAISSPRLKTKSKIKSTVALTGLPATEFADAEWLAFQPDHENEQLKTIKRLHPYLEAEDDWTRLLAINNLITLSAGTPDLVVERNRLCDKAMQQPEEFTFPAELREATQDKEWFNLPEIIAIIFLHEPGDPFLKPEWFDPKNEESKFFLSPPGEFFALAAEVLDPEGKTELAKWRK